MGAKPKTGTAKTLRLTEEQEDAVLAWKGLTFEGQAWVVEKLSAYDGYPTTVALLRSFMKRKPRTP